MRCKLGDKECNTCKYFKALKTGRVLGIGCERPRGEYYHPKKEPLHEMVKKHLTD